MRAWLLVLAVLATFHMITPLVASTEDVSLTPSTTTKNTDSYTKFLDSTSSNRVTTFIDNNNLVNSDSDIHLVKASRNSESSSSSSNNSSSTKNNKELNEEEEEVTQTTRQKPNAEQLVEIEKNLLSLFGFKGRPRIDRAKVVIPEAMKQLYAQIMGHELDSINIPKPGLHTKNANTVRSFTHEGM